MTAEETFSQVWKDSNYPKGFTLNTGFVNEVIIPAMEKYKNDAINELNK